MEYQLHHGDCLEVLRRLEPDSIDAIVTDPPYGLAFMGKRWDYDVPSEEVWRECLRVLKPGGHLLAFAGTRTQHRMAVRIEDAGFEIRDMIAWVYGSGFPKSLDVSKAIDREAGAERETVRVKPRPETSGTMAGSSDTRPWIEKSRELGYHEIAGKDPVTAAATWQGWGTALKPALEPITVARKPLIGTVAANVLEHGTGALNVNGCRVGMSSQDAAYISERIGGFNSTQSIGGNGAYSGGEAMDRAAAYDASKGRWPANLIHDGSDEVVGVFPVTGASKATPGNNREFKSVAKGRDLPHVSFGHEDNGGSAARFFYCAKASKADRDEGCEGLEAKSRLEDVGNKWTTVDYRDGYKRNVMARNHHPTVKPTDLMRYLCRLVTPPGGVVLDPFMGSGSTGKACMAEGFRFVGIEREAEYIEIAEARIKAAIPEQIGLL